VRLPHENNRHVRHQERVRKVRRRFNRLLSGSHTIPTKPKRNKTTRKNSSLSKKHTKLPAWITFLIICTFAALFIHIVPPLIITPDTLRTVLVHAAEDATNLPIECAGLQYSVLSGIQLSNVVVYDSVKSSNTIILSCGKIIIRYNIITILLHGAALQKVQLIRPMVNIIKTADGTINIQSVIARANSETNITAQGNKLPSVIMRGFINKLIFNDARVAYLDMTKGSRVPTVISGDIEVYKLTLGRATMLPLRFKIHLGADKTDYGGGSKSYLTTDITGIFDARQNNLTATANTTGVINNLPVNSVLSLQSSDLQVFDLNGTITSKALFNGTLQGQFDRRSNTAYLMSSNLQYRTIPVTFTAAVDDVQEQSIQFTLQCPELNLKDIIPVSGSGVALSIPGSLDVSGRVPLGDMEHISLTGRFAFQKGTVRIDGFTNAFILGKSTVSFNGQSIILNALPVWYGAAQYHCTVRIPKITALNIYADIRAHDSVIVENFIPLPNTQEGKKKKTETGNSGGAWKITAAVRAPAAVYQHQTFHAIDGKVQITSHSVHVTRFFGKAYNGSLTAALQFPYSDNEPELQINGTMKGIHLKPLLNVLNDTDSGIDGVVNGSVHITLHPNDDDSISRLTAKIDIQKSEVHINQLTFKDFTANITVRKKIISAERINARFCRGPINGSFHLDLNQILPAYDFTITGSRCRLSDLVSGYEASLRSVMKGDLNFTLSGSTRGEASDDIFKNLVVHGSLNGSQIGFNKMSLDDYSADIAMEKGTIAINNLNGMFHGGTVYGKTRIDLNAADPSYTMSFEAKKVNLDSLYEGYKHVEHEKATCIIDFEVALEGWGLHPDAMARNLKGSGSFKSTSGRELRNTFFQRAMIQSIEGSKLPFSKNILDCLMLEHIINYSFSGEFGFENGYMEFNNTSIAVSEPGSSYSIRKVQIPLQAKDKKLAMVSVRVDYDQDVYNCIGPGIVMVLNKTKGFKPAGKTENSYYFTLTVNDFLP